MYLDLLSLWSAFLWLNRHRAICAELRRSVDHARSIWTKSMSGDVDGAALALRGGAENLTVLELHNIRIEGDRAANRPRTTGNRGGDLTVAYLNLIGLHLDGPTVAV